MTPDSSSASQPASRLTVSPDLEKKFPELLALIRSSESMNDEERQYWVNILPVMTQEQVKNLSDILQNEKNQLAAIDAKYADPSAAGKSLDEIERERKEKKEKRSAAEARHLTEEEKATENLLKQIES